MTNLENLLLEVDQNQLKIQKFGVFDSKILQKINYKLRLDWNYYSNRMEGGTLTRSETRSVMVGNVDVKGKPLRDVVEMSGHDQVVLEVLKMSKGEHRISERRIKEIHAAIMHEEDSDLKKEVGQWKSTPNEIINYKNEKIEFAPPLDVPEKIHSLLNTANAEYDKFEKGVETDHPVVLAAKFHLDFVTIHPFYDGNGRMSRILTNIILMSYGFPALIIKDDVRKGYYQLLADVQAYGGDPQLFYAFVAERVLESQQLILDALEGKEIEEIDDIDKEIQLWKQNLTSDDKVIKRDRELQSAVYKNSIKPLLEFLISKTAQFDDLFTEKRMTVRIENMGQPIENLNHLDEFFQFWKLSDRTDAQSVHHTLAADNNFNHVQHLRELNFEIYYNGFKKNGINPFDERVDLNFVFEDFAYVLKKGHKNEFVFKKLYSQEITKEERESYVIEQVKKLFDDIKSHVNRINKI